jgi:hypothetical protein
MPFFQVTGHSFSTVTAFVGFGAILTKVAFAFRTHRLKIMADYLSLLFLE